MTAKAGPGRPPKKQITDDDFKELDIEQLFSEIPHGYAVRVRRLEPKWCAGYQGTIHIDKENPLTEEDIAAQFGGTKLQLTFVDNRSKIKAHRTVDIAEIPKKNFEPISPDFAQPGGTMTQRPGEQSQTPNMPGYDPQAFAAWGLPPLPPGTPPIVQMRLMDKMINQMFPEEKKENPTEFAQQKMMMDWMQMQSQTATAQMQAQSQAQQQQAQMQSQQQQMALEMQNEMFKMRRKYADDVGPNNPLGDVKQSITLIKDLQEMGIGEAKTHVATEITTALAPLVENAVDQLMEFKKMAMKRELAQIEANAQAKQVQPLQARQIPGKPPAAQLPPTPDTDGENSPEQLAAHMGKLYASLGEEDREKVMNAFVSSMETGVNDEIDPEESTENDDNVENIQNEFEDIPENDTLDESLLADEDDVATLRGDKVAPEDTKIGENQGQVTDLSNRLNTGAAQNNA